MLKNLRLSFVIGILLIIVIYFSFHMYNGILFASDTGFHLFRIDGIMQNINSGKLNSINPLYLETFGYASPLFYTDFMLYPVVYFAMKLSNNDVTIYMMVFIFYLLMTFVISSLSYYNIRKNNIESLLFALLYTLCNYHIYNIYYRGALSEYIAMTFLPLFILAIYKINFALENDKFTGKEYLIFVLSMTTVIFSHALSSIMLFYMYIICFIIMFIKHRKKIKYFITNLILNSILILGISTLYLLPFIEQVLSQKFYFQLNTDIAIKAYDFHAFLSTFLSFTGILNIFIFIPIIMFIFVLIIRKRDFFISLIFTLLLISIFFITQYSNIEHIPLLSMIQFQWRFSSFIWLFASFLTVYSIHYFSDIKKFKIFRLIIIFVTLLFPIGYCFTIYQATIDGDMRYEMPSEIVHKSIVRCEYLPAKINREYIDNYDEQNTKTTYDNGVYNIELLSDDEEYELPIIYYKGYTSNDDVTISESSNGLILVSDVNGLDNIIVYYNPTFIQILARVLFLMSICVTFIYYLIIYRKH